MKHWSLKQQLLIASILLGYMFGVESITLSAKAVVEKTQRATAPASTSVAKASPTKAPESPVASKEPEKEEEASREELLYDQQVRKRLIKLYDNVLERDLVAQEEEKLLKEQLAAAQRELSEIREDIQELRKDAAGRGTTKDVGGAVAKERALTPEEQNKVRKTQLVAEKAKASAQAVAKASDTVEAARSAVSGGTLVVNQPTKAIKKFKVVQRSATKKIPRGVTPEKQALLAKQEEEASAAAAALERFGTVTSESLAVVKGQNIEIPFFGTIKIRNKKKKLVAKLDKRKIVIDGLKLYQIEAIVTKKGKLKLVGKASILGMHGEFNLKSQADGAFLFRIKLNKELFVLATPTAERKIPNLFLTLAKDKKQLFAKTKHFSHDDKEVIMTFDITGTNPHGIIKMPEVHVPDFLTGTKDRKLVVKNGVITIEQALSGGYTATVIEGESTLEGFYPEASKMFEIGSNKVTLVIPDMNAFEFLYSADAKYNGIEGELVLDLVDGNDRLFSFFPKQDLLFPVTIYDEAWVDVVQLAYKEGKVSFTAKTSAYDKNGEPNTVIKLSTDKTVVDGVIDLPEVNLKDLMGDAAVQKIVVVKPSVVVRNLMTTATDASIVIKGKTSLTSFLSSIPGKPKVENIDITTTIDYENGFKTALQFAPELTFIPNFVALKKPTLTLLRPLGTPEDLAQIKQEDQDSQTAEKAIDQAAKSKGLLGKVAGLVKGVKDKLAPVIKKAKKMKKMAKVALRSDILLTGNLEAEVKGVGKLSTDITGKFVGGMLEKLEGKLRQELNFMGKLKLGNAFIAYYVPERLGRISVTASILGFDVVGNIDFKKVFNPDKDKEETQTVFNASPKQQEFSPFSGIGVPGLDKFKLIQPTIGFNMKTKVFFLEGSMQVLTMRQKVRIAYKKDKRTKQKIVTAKMSFGDDFRLSKIMPFIKGTPFDGIDFTEAFIMISSAKYYDDELDMRIQKGLSIVSTIKPTGAIGGVASMFPGGNEGLTLSGSIGTSMADVKLSVIIPFEVKFSSTARLSNLSIELDLAEQSFALLGQMEVRPSKKDDPLFLTLRGEVSPMQAIIAATMEGEWRNPLGIKGFAIGNVAVEVGIDFPVFTATGLPSTFGITGEVDVGGVQMMMAAKISANLSECIMMGKLNKLGLHNILKMVNAAGGNIPLDKVPNIAVKDIEMKWAPKGGSIGEIVFDPGITCKGRLEVADKWAMMELTIDTGGIIAKAAMSKIVLGPLRIDGKGFDRKYGTQDDGPVIDIALTMGKQEIFISGLIELLGARSQTEIYMRPQQWEIFTETKLADLFLVKFELFARLTNDPDFRFKGILKNDFYEFVRREVRAGLDKFSKKASEDINKAKRKVDAINGDIRNLQGQVDSRHRKIAELKRIIKEKTERAKRKVRDARNKVKSAEKKVNSIKRTIDKKKRQMATNIMPTNSILIPNSRIYQKIHPQDKQLVNNEKLHSIEHSLMSMDEPTQLDYIYQLAVSEDGASITLQEFEHLLAWGWFRRAVRTVSRGVSEAAKKAAAWAKKQALRAKIAAEIAGLWIAHKAALGALKIAQGILHAAEEAAFDPTAAKEAAEITKEGIEIAGLETAKGTLIASRETAKGILEAAKQSAKGIAQAGKFMVKGAMGAIEVHKAIIAGNLDDIKDFKLPALSLSGKFFGKQVNNAKFQLDLKRPHIFIENVFNFIIKVVKPF